MFRVITCIGCPNSCEMDVELKEQGGKQEIVSIVGHTCPKGEEYARQEVEHPMRTFATSVPVKNGERPLVSVRLSGPVPKEEIFPVMAEIRKISTEAPVSIGDVLAENLLGLGVNLIAAANVGQE